MSSRFPSVPLGDLCEVAIGRQRSPKNHAGDHMVQYLRAANVKDGRLDLSNVNAMNFDPSEQESYALRRGDVLVTEGCGSPAELGASARWNEGLTGTVCFQNTLLRLRARPGISDPGYLYLLARWCHSSGAWLTASSGTSILHIGHTRAKRISVPVPTFDVQRKIGFVISAYDDLIENNNRRIKLLEEMAQRIYREWFVDFRYPGHESVPLVDSELGSIPEGWVVGSIGDHADVVRGRSYRGVDVVEDGGVPFVTLKCLERDGGFRTDGVKRYAGAFKPAHMARVGDIVMAVTDMTQERRIVARAARIPRLNDEIGVFSMDLVKIVPSDISAEYLLGLLSYSDFADRVKAHANGANVLHLHPDRISDFRMVFAPSEIEERYAAVISPAQDLTDVLQLASFNLRATRDLLLPRLISGVVDVADLDIVVSEAAA